AGVDVGRAVAARTTAVESADRDVVSRRGGDGDVGKRRRDGRAMAAETVGDPLVCAGDRIERVVARCGVALRARRTRRNVIRWPDHIAGERGGIVALATVARPGVIRVELNRRT